MTGAQSSSPALTPPALGISSTFTPFQRAPKPHSDFPLVTEVMHKNYLEAWNAKIESFNTFVLSSRASYLDLPMESHDERRTMLESLTRQINFSRLILVIELDGLEEELEFATLPPYTVY